MTTNPYEPKFVNSQIWIYESSPYKKVKFDLNWSPVFKRFNLQIQLGKNPKKVCLVKLFVYESFNPK
jgi:hypothetical protein